MVVALLLLCLYLASHLVTNVYWHSGPVGEMGHNTHTIAIALLKYRQDRDGSLPGHLSELVPSYIGPSNLNCFFWPPLPRRTIRAYAKSEAIFTKIDNEGAYVYLGTQGLPVDLILYERTNLWAVAKGETPVVTLTSNFATRLLSTQDAASRVQRTSGRSGPSGSPLNN